MEEYKGEIWEEVHANDYYFEYVDGQFLSDKGQKVKLPSIFERFLGTGFDEVSVVIKAEKGKIIIENVNEHNTENTPTTA